MRVIPLVAGLVLASVQPAGADTSRVARLCAKGSRHLPDATTRLQQFHQALENAANDAPSGPLLKQLNDVLATPCFQVAEASGELDTSKATTLALKRWWKDGGHEWLARQLSTDGTMTFPPSLRETLSLEHAPKHRLARLLCRATDRTCGRETAGWIARAEEAFRAHAKATARWRGDGYTLNLYSRSSPPKEDDAASPRSQTLDVPLWRCANPSNGQRDFKTWTGCVGALRKAVPLFPVGAVRAPTSGWLVIRGRRGHYQFCDQLTAFDLATGSYYVSKSCSGLALQGDGSVDAQKTDAARTPVLETGRVSVDNLREAAWMMFLATELDDRGYEAANAFPLPPALEPAIQVGAGARYSLGFRGSISSAQTTLAWAWIDRSQVVAEGTLTWPGSADVREDYAVDLLRVAEAGLVPGCPPAPLPNPLLDGCGKGGVSKVDTSAANLCEVQAELSARLATFTCKRDSTR